jgi:hypothetical protein
MRRFFFNILSSITLFFIYLGIGIIGIVGMVMLVTVIVSQLSLIWENIG